MRMAVYGAGGVGGYFGGRLAQAGAEVHFIARGVHLQALRERGLRVRSVKGDFAVEAQATDDPADGTPVPPSAQPQAIAMAQSLEPGAFSSLHNDLVAGRPMELDALHGFVVRRAAERGVPVPMSEAVYAILEPWAVRNQRTGR
jgi:ketopantoate reductase